jgi:hypothetical protein
MPFSKKQREQALIRARLDSDNAVAQAVNNLADGLLPWEADDRCAYCGHQRPGHDTTCAWPKARRLLAEAQS